MITPVELSPPSVPQYQLYDTNTGIPLKTVRNYGTLTTYGDNGKKSENTWYSAPENPDTFYANGEYGSADPVSLTGIQQANAGTRSSGLTTKHDGKVYKGSDVNYDYDNAQKNTDAARKWWQDAEGNREKDFLNYVKQYQEILGNENAPLEQIIGHYNQAIDKLYEFKHQMATPDYTGDSSYLTDNSVGEFNRTHKLLYSSANSNEYLGYDKDSENINGTTTAQRFIDITDDDVPINLSEYFGEDDTDLQNLFEGKQLYKDSTGRYYLLDTNIDFSQPASTPSTSATSSVNPTETESSNEERKKQEEENADKIKTTKNLANLAKASGFLTELAPNAIAVGRYLAARAHNKAQYDIARQMPVMLYNPMERTKWVTGDHAAIQQGYQAAGQLNHLAAQPIISDGNIQSAVQLQGFMNGRKYIDPGWAQHTATAQQSASDAWNQEGINWQNRHGTAEKNKENLFNHRANVLAALGTYKRANYESLNNLLASFETQLDTHLADTKALREAYAEASLKNDITANMAKYGIPVTENEQTFINSIATGQKKIEDLTEEEKALYNRLSVEIEEQVNARKAAAIGAFYSPYPRSTILTAGSGWSPFLIFNQRRGGKIEVRDSEKVAIQKLRNKLGQMQVFQKRLQSRLNAYEKDLDRAQKSASEYVRGQKRK